MIVQRQAILAGVALGVKSLYSGEYLEQIRDEAKQADQGAGARVKNVIIVDDQGNIKDSLDKNQNPQWNPDKSIRFVMVKDISLPPLNSALGLPPDNTPLPEGMNVVPESRAGSAGAHIHGQLVLGVVVAGVASYCSVRFLMRYFKTRTLTPFAIYCVVFGALSIFRFG